MKIDTLIEHKETIVVCEESEPFNLNYNFLLTTPKANTMIKPIVPVITTKSALTCTNCGKTCQSLEMSQPHFEGSVKSPLTLPKMGVWSPPRLLKTQKTIAGVKKPRIEVFFIPLQRS
jgi:hypothetical protein